MRKLTVILAAVVCGMLAFTGWFLLGGTLQARVYVQTAPAADYPEAFGSIRSLIESGSAPQILGQEPLREDASAYTLVDITVTLSNRGLFPAEWLDIRTSGTEGDIAVYALIGEGRDIAPRESGQVELKLVTTARADAVRDVTIQYYVYGMKREITVR